MHQREQPAANHSAREIQQQVIHIRHAADEQLARFDAQGQQQAHQRKPQRMAIPLPQQRQEEAVGDEEQDVSPDVNEHLLLPGVPQLPRNGVEQPQLNALARPQPMQRRRQHISRRSPCAAQHQAQQRKQQRRERHQAAFVQAPVLPRAANDAP